MRGVSPFKGDCFAHPLCILLSKDSKYEQQQLISSFLWLMISFGTLVVRFEECISHYDLTGQPGRWILYCVSEAGNLYKVEEQMSGHQEDVRESSGNHEIFTDLLNDDMATFVPSRASVPLRYVSKSSAVHNFSATVLCFSCYGNILAVCALNHSTYVTQVYSVSGSNSPSLLTSFSLPKAKDCDSKRAHGLLYFCACPFTEETCVDIISSSMLSLSTTLYTGVFGRSPMLLKSDVILFCPPVGCVFYAPLKSLDCSNQLFDWTELKLLHHTSQSVKSVCSTKLKEKRDKKKKVFDTDNDDYDFTFKDAVMITAIDGKCIIIIQESELHYMDLLLPGPVVDLSVCGTIVFVTTERDLYRLELEVTYHNGDPEVSIIKKDSLHLTNVLHLLCLPDNSEIIDRTCQLLCNFKSGKVEIINPDERLSVSELSDSKNSGKKIKDLLQCIESCKRESIKLKRLKSGQTIFLQQLHLAAYLLSTDDRKSSLFQCKITTTTPLSGSLCDVCICCHITNTSKLSISKDWTVIVHISQHDCTNKSVSESVKLAQDFSEGETISILTNLPSLEIKVPYQVEITLLLHIPSTMENIGIDGEQTLPVTIYTQSVDLLYFLHLSEKFHRMIRWSDPEPDEVIYQLAMKQPISKTLMEKSILQSRIQEESCAFDLYFVANDKLREQEMLQLLFGDSLVSVDVIPNPMSLLSLAGHKACIAISRYLEKGQGQEIWKLTFQTDSTSLAATIRLCIVRRFQELHFSHVHLNSSKDSSPIADARNSLSDLHKKMSEIRCDATVDNSEKLLTLYKQLRQTQY